MDRNHKYYTKDELKQLMVKYKDNEEIFDLVREYLVFMEENISYTQWLKNCSCDPTPQKFRNVSISKLADVPA